MEKNQSISGIKSHHTILKSKAFLIILVAFFGVKIFISIFLPNKNVSIASSLSHEAILQAVNEQRSLRNLVTLNFNSKLSTASQGKADDMQARHYFSHIDPDGKYIWDRIIAAGYSPYSQLGENLAVEFYDTESLMSAWMNSPTHRANILQEGFKDQGMGLTFGNSSAGQYHSAVVNAFGSLAVSSANKPAPTAAPKSSVSPTPTPSPKPAPKSTPSPLPPPAPAPAPMVPKPSPASVPEQKTLIDLLLPRGEPLVINQEADFTLPSQDQRPAQPSENQNTAPAIVAEESKILNGFEANRYLILIAGCVFLLLILSDLQSAIEKKLFSHKKISNVAVLVISLIVIGLLYWL